MATQTTRNDKPLPQEKTVVHHNIKRWLPRLGDKPNAKVRLYCFSHAGGGASVYYPWNSYFSDAVEVCPVQLPGREERLGEPLIDDFENLIGSLLPIIASSIDRPYAIYGHSLGACIGYEIAKRLYTEYALSPLCYFGGAHRSPCKPYYYPSVRGLPNAELTKMVTRFNGLPQAFLDSQEMMDLMLPVLRSDLFLCESYRYVPSLPLPSDIIVFSGQFDRNVTADKLSSWKNHSTKEVTFISLDGDHFFLKTHKNNVLEVVQSTCESLLGCKL
ncbi:thioesterase II family protein [Teredinibacter purpureus]|uniref:thioesterase II family protein n=1 Tax=Teredinibacter purpureus TaxID=2731756 RepID=UPI000697E283|nr:thioesterase domain-containing protein [Teredinibacter purpureus]